MRHLRRMRSLYAERQEVLVHAATRDLHGLLEISPAQAGMHLVAWLPREVSDRRASTKAARYGVEAAPLSAYAAAPQARGALVLGYAAVNTKEIRAGVRKLTKALSS